MTDWVTEMFPGDGVEIPTDAERDCADEVIASAAARWGERVVTIARHHPDTNQPTNRAWLRSRLRRWWHGKPVGQPKEAQQNS